MHMHNSDSMYLFSMTLTIRFCRVVLDPTSIKVAIGFEILDILVTVDLPFFVRLADWGYKNAYKEWDKWMGRVSVKLETRVSISMEDFTFGAALSFGWFQIMTLGFSQYL